MDSDPWLNEEVLGSEPDPEKHTTVFVVNPQSGLPLEIAVRMQINMALNDLSSIAHSGKFSNMVLPLLWTEIVSDGKFYFNFFFKEPTFFVILSEFLYKKNTYRFFVLLDLKRFPFPSFENLPLPIYFF